MSTNTGGIQPVASVGPWVAPEAHNKDAPSVSRVNGTEGGTASKVGEFNAESDANLSLRKLGFSAEVVEQIQSFQQDNPGIALNFMTNGGKTTVQIINKNTGKVIREISLENLAQLCGKEEALRGILFDGQA